MARKHTHTHPCQFEDEGCTHVVECDGELSANYDGYPLTICDRYHHLGGTFADVPCDTCQDAMTVTEDDTVEAMEQTGGSFVKALAACYRRADDTNRVRLRLAFADEWEEYRELAGILKRRSTHAPAR